MSILDRIAALFGRDTDTEKYELSALLDGPPIPPLSRLGDRAMLEIEDGAQDAASRVYDWLHQNRVRPTRLTAESHDGQVTVTARMRLTPEQVEQIRATRPEKIQTYDLSTI